MTSYTLNLDMLREGVTYDFRVIAVNDYGYGSPSAPSPSISGTLNWKRMPHCVQINTCSVFCLLMFVMCSAQKVSPFYEEWWFLVVIALVGLIFILLLVFILIIRGQSKKYTKKADSGREHDCLLNSLLTSQFLSLCFCNPSYRLEFVFLLDSSAENCILMIAHPKSILENGSVKAHTIRQIT